MCSDLGVAEEKLLALDGDLDPALFSETERVVLEYADAITCSDQEVSDELFARVAALFGDEALIEQVKAYYTEQGMFRTPNTPDPIFTDVLELDLGTVVPAISGPRLPQELIQLNQAKSKWRQALLNLLGDEVTADEAAKAADEAAKPLAGDKEFTEKVNKLKGGPVAEANKERDAAAKAVAMRCQLSSIVLSTASPASVLRRYFMSQMVAERPVRVFKVVNPRPRRSKGQ